MDSKPIKNNFALRIIILAAYLLSILFLTTPALSFTNKLISALKAIENGTATEGQKALAYHNYNTVQNMSYHGQENGGISDNTFQKYMKSFLKKNNTDIVEAGRQNGVEIKFQQRKTITLGTDTDAIGDIKSMKQLQNTNKSYQNIKRNFSEKNGIKLSGNENFRKIYNTDIMVDPGGVSQTQFEAMNKTMSGTTYKNAGSVRYEAGKRAAQTSGEPFRPSISDSIDYMEDQLRNSREKGNVSNAKLDVAKELNKNPASKIKGTRVWTKYKNTEAEMQFNQADQSKAINRLQDVGKDLSKAHNVDTPKYSKLPDLGKTRGEGQLSKSSVVKALDKRLTQQAVKNNAEVLADIGKKNPSMRIKTNQSIAKITKDLPASQKGELIESIRNKHGNAAAKDLAKEMRKTSSGTPLSGGPTLPPIPSGGIFGDSSFTLTKGKLSIRPTSTHTGVVGKAVGVAGYALMGLQVYDLLKEYQETGDTKTVATKGVIMAGTTWIGAKVFGTFAAAAPVTSAWVGTGMVAWHGTREIMSRVTVNGKSLDEHTQQKIDDEYYYSSRHDTEANVDLQNLLKNALKGGKWELPNGMTRGEAIQKALDNSNKRKKPVLGFLENVQARLKAKQETLSKAAEEKLRIDSEKLKAELKAEEEARIKAEKEAKLKAAAESPSTTAGIIAKPEVPQKKWDDMTGDEKRKTLTTGQDSAWQSHVDAIIKAQKNEKVTGSGEYDPTKDPGTGISTDPTVIAKADKFVKKFQQEVPAGQGSTQTGGALGGGFVSPQSPGYTGGGANIGAGIPITVSGIPTIGPPLPPPGGGNVGGGTTGKTGAAGSAQTGGATAGGTGNIGAGRPGGVPIGSTTGANVGGSGTGKQQCSINDMCSVLPDSTQLGVNSGLMTQCARQSGTQTTFTKSWSATGSSRSVNITMTIYSTVAAAKADVQKYGASCGNGCTPVNIGNGGYKTTNITYPYFKIYSNNVVITYSSHKATRKAIPAQDNYVSNIAQKINALNCQPGP